MDLFLFYVTDLLKTCVNTKYNETVICPLCLFPSLNPLYAIIIIVGVSLILNSQLPKDTS